MRLFFSPPCDLLSSAQGAWDGKSHPGSPETLGMGSWKISMSLESVKGQGLEVSLEVQSGLSRHQDCGLILGQ